MTPAPERALELADYLEHKLDNDQDALVKFAAMSTKEVKAEIAAILRRYAEIAPKWQAVLDAKPVAIIHDGTYTHEGEWASQVVRITMNPLAAYEELIIKPGQ